MNVGLNVINVEFESDGWLLGIWFGWMCDVCRAAGDVRVILFRTIIYRGSDCEFERSLCLFCMWNYVGIWKCLSLLNGTRKHRDRLWNYSDSFPLGIHIKLKVRVARWNLKPWRKWEDFEKNEISEKIFKQTLFLVTTSLELKSLSLKNIISRIDKTSLKVKTKGNFWW